MQQMIVVLLTLTRSLGLPVNIGSSAVPIGQVDPCTSTDLLTHIITSQQWLS